MKIMKGLRLNPKPLFVGKALIDTSTRYDDRDIQQGTAREKLVRLKRNIAREITVATPFILTLEELEEQYHHDAQAALVDDNFGYYMRYHVGIERCRILIANSYHLLPNVV